MSHLLLGAGVCPDKGGWLWYNDSIIPWIVCAREWEKGERERERERESQGGEEAIVEYHCTTLTCLLSLGYMVSKQHSWEMSTSMQKLMNGWSHIRGRENCTLNRCCYIHATASANGTLKIRSIKALWHECNHTCRAWEQKRNTEMELQIMN